MAGTANIPGVSAAETEYARRPVWPLLAWFSLLLGICYGPTLWRLVQVWDRDPDMGHGFFVPAVSAGIVWLKRERLERLPVAPNPWGVVLVAYAGVQFYVATIGAEIFLARTAFIISLIGITLALFGAHYVRELAFALGLLFFMVPIPSILYNQVALPLQFLASRGAEHALQLLNIPVRRAGNILEVSGHELLVATACSGIRSLLSLGFVALAYGYFCEQRLWMRALLFVAAVPTALAANMARVTLTGLFAARDPKLTEGALHSFLGWLIFVIATLGLIGFHWLTSKVNGKR